MPELLQWPAPPQFTTPPDADNNALVTFADGKRVLGVLLQLAPDRQTLVFLPNNADTNVNIPMDRIRTIRLVTPLRLRKQELSLEGKEVFPASEKQTFTVEFNDHEVMTGETIGFVSRKEGLYLFLLNEGGKVVRCLVPAQSLEQFQIGAPIGQLLIDEKAATPQDIAAGLKKQQELRSQKIGDYLVADQIVTPEQLAIAIERQKAAPQMKLGEALLQEKLITQAQLDEALAKQQKDRKTPLGAFLVEMGIVDRSTLRRVLAKKLGIPAVGLRKFNVDVSVTQLVPLSLAQKHNVMPLCRNDDRLIVALENPMDWTPQEELRFSTKMTIEPVMATAEDITYAINRYYGVSAPGTEAHDDKDDLALYKSVAADTGDAPKAADADQPLMKLIHRTVLDAQERGVAEIHVETFSGKQNSKIRFGKGESLTLYLEVPALFRHTIAPKLKALAQLDLSEKQKPQNGTIDFGQLGTANVKMTVTTTPTDEGERLVLAFTR